MLLAASSTSARSQSVDQILKNQPPQERPLQPATKQQPAAQHNSTKKGTATSRTASTPTQSTPSNSHGFRINLPAGWRASLAQDSAIVARSANGDSSVVIAPVLAAGNASPADWLRRSGSAALSAYLNNASVAQVYASRNSRQSALAAVRYNSPSGPGTANILYLASGGIGTLYVIAAPSAVFPQQRPALVGILQSFSFTGEKTAAPSAGAASHAAANVGYTRFRDPNEGSFTVDVPAGWKTQGGLVRKSTVDVRPFVFSTSPDGATVIRFGDPELGAFTTPNQMLAMGGFREGSAYSPGYGNVMIVRRYIPGPAFAQEYAVRLARSLGASNPEFKTVRPLPEFSSNTSIGAALQRATAGEASFTCTRNGQEAGGTVFAQTTGTSMPGTEGELWYVSALVDFLAPAPQAATADQIARHIVGTFQLNPNWVAQQQQTTMKTSQIVTETNEHISRIINDTYWSRQAVVDRTNRNFDDYIRGVVRLRDPNTGEELEGVAGKNYYYRVPATNRTVGANTEIRDPDFTELEQVR